MVVMSAVGTAEVVGVDVNGSALVPVPGLGGLVGVVDVCAVVADAGVQTDALLADVVEVDDDDVAVVGEEHLEGWARVFGRMMWRMRGLDGASLCRWWY